MHPSRVVGGPALASAGLSLFAYAESVEEEEFDIKEIQGPLVVSCRKRRARKLKEPLESKFLRRSGRRQPEHGGCFYRESGEHGGCLH